MKTGHILSGVVLLISLAFTACGDDYADVAVVNGFDDGKQIANVKFCGCVWPDLLTQDKRTTQHQCMTCESPVYYDLFDPTTPSVGWRHKKTGDVYKTDDDERYTFIINNADDPIDSTVPGPYGH